MRKLFIAATPETRNAFACEREVVDFASANLTQVSTVVMTATEALQGLLDEVE